MPRSLLPTPDKPGLRGRIPDLKPSLFRVVLGVSMVLFALLLQWYLTVEGHMAGITALGVFGSIVFGALAYWLAQSFLTFIVIFCPLIAIIALIAGIWGWATS